MLQCLFELLGLIEIQAFCLPNILDTVQTHTACPSLKHSLCDMEKLIEGARINHGKRVMSILLC